MAGVQRLHRAYECNILVDHAVMKPGANLWQLLLKQLILHFFLLLSLVPTSQCAQGWSARVDLLQGSTPQNVCGYPPSVLHACQRGEIRLTVLPKNSLTRALKITSDLKSPRFPFCCKGTSHFLSPEQKNLRCNQPGAVEEFF